MFMNKKVLLFVGIGVAVLAACVAISLNNPLKPAEGKNKGVVTMYPRGYSMSGYYQRVQGLPLPDSTSFTVSVDTDFPFSQLKKVTL